MGMLGKVPFGSGLFQYNEITIYTACTGTGQAMRKDGQSNCR
jgi:hypothetical protein